MGKFHLILLSVSGFSLMSVALENNNIGFVLPYARCDIDMSTAEQGILGSIVYVGTIISSQFWGIMADATGRRRILLISMAGTFIFSMLTAFTFNINTLIITRLFGGILYDCLMSLLKFLHPFVWKTKRKKILVLQVFNHHVTRTSVNFIAVKREQRLVLLLPCLSNSRSFYFHYWHGESFRYNWIGKYTVFP